MKTPYRVAFMPRNLRNAAPIGGASLILPKGNTSERQAAAWTLIGWLTSPEIAGEWSRFTGYFAPRRAAYDLPEMKDYLQQHPDAKVALDLTNCNTPSHGSTPTTPSPSARPWKTRSKQSSPAKRPRPKPSKPPRKTPTSCCAPMSNKLR
jgi:ABC-type glycerol-3-phosphate transport system substrate-binding protein